jgi:hypothetical protein
MGRLTTAEAHLDFDLVALFQEPPRGPYAHLQIVIVGAWAQAHLFDF